MADIWSEKDVGFIGPMTFLSDLTVGPTYFAKSALTKFVFFGPIGKTRWAPWRLICWDIFDFSSETTEWSSTKLDRKEDLNVLYQVCVFRADWKNKIGALASDWLRHFRLLWNRWTECNESWQEAISQRPVPSLCFSDRSVNKNVRLDWFLKEVAHCSQVHDMWPFGPLVCHYFYFIFFCLSKFFRKLTPPPPLTKIPGSAPVTITVNKINSLTVLNLICLQQTFFFSNNSYA